MALARGGMRVYADGGTIYFDHGNDHIVMCDAVLSSELTHDIEREFVMTESGHSFEAWAQPIYRVGLECMGFRHVKGSLPEITKDMLGKMSVRDLFKVIETKIEGRT